MKYNSAGVLQWNRTWGGVGSDPLESVSMDSSNNIYLTGWTKSFGAGGSDGFIVKYNDAGELQWNCTWGGTELDICRAIVSDSSNNVYITGGTSSFGAGEWDLFIAKFNSVGIQEWNYTWGGTEHEEGWTMASDVYNNVYILGITDSYGIGNLDMCLLKFSSSGVLLWNRTWGGNETDWSTKIVIDSSNNIYIVGATNNPNGRVLVKYDSTGKQIWNQTLSLPSDIIIFYDIVLGSLGDIYLLEIVQGGVVPNHWSDILLEKYDSTGKQLWNQTWDKTVRDEVGDFKLDSADNIYIAGSIEIEVTSSVWGQNDIIMLKYDNSGALYSETSWGGDEYDSASEISLNSLGNIYIAGATTSFGAGMEDLCLIKLVEITEVIIPGYDLLLLILILSSVSIITLNSRFTKSLIRKRT
ncbi:MAG: SBBP repeat-containing protein [Promethearchaeota archaeon]